MLFSLLTAALMTFTPPEAGTIQGFVRVERSYEPIAFATVAIPALNRMVQSDAHGFFVLSGVPAGTWRVEASALGYRSNILTIVTAESGRLRLDFELQLKPVVLPGVTARTNPDEVTGAAATVEAGPLPMRVEGAALKLVPGLAEADVLRALQVLPAVSAISDFSTALYVRGGSADQNLIELDGMPLFNPYHVGGVFSAISADAVAGVDVWTGALPARSGDRIASAVVINAREGGKDRTRVSGSLGLISTTLTVDGPLNKGRGSYLFSGRRTYVDAITGAAYGLGLIDITMPYGFNDAYFKATHRIGELGSVSLSAYWDGEGVSTPERMHFDMGGYGEFDWGSRMISLQFRQPLSGSLLLEARGGYSDFHGGFDWWSIAQNIVCDATCRGGGPADTTQVVDASTLARDFVGVADLTWYAPNHKLQAGVQLDVYDFTHRITAVDVDEDLLRPFDKNEPLSTSAVYVEDEWRANDVLTLRAGLRWLSAGRLGTALLPRVGLRWQLTPALAFTAGAGRYAQPLRSMKDDESVVSSFIAYDILTTQPEDVGLMRGSDVLGGVEYVNANTTLRVDAFWKSATNLVMATQPADPLNIPPLVIDTFRTGSSEAYGAELSARREFGRVSLGASYALLFASRTANDGEVFAPRYERRHQLDLSTHYRWGRAGILSARLMVASGQPHTPALGVSYVATLNPTTGMWEQPRNVLVLGEHNSARLPGYFRLDIAARREYARRWFGRDVVFTPYLQVINVLNNKNALIAEAKTLPGQPRFNYWPQLPVLPTFGVEWRF